MVRSATAAQALLQFPSRLPSHCSASAWLAWVTPVAESKSCLAGLEGRQATSDQQIRGGFFFTGEPLLFEASNWVSIAPVKARKSSLSVPRDPSCFWMMTERGGWAVPAGRHLRRLASASISNPLFISSGGLTRACARASSHGDDDPQDRPLAGGNPGAPVASGGGEGGMRRRFAPPPSASNPSFITSRVRILASPVALGWRRGRDSNPRRCRHLAGFQDRCIQPLCHLSEGGIVHGCPGPLQATRSRPAGGKPHGPV